MKLDDEIDTAHEYPGAEYVEWIAAGRVPLPRFRRLPLLTVLGLLLPPLLYISIGAVTAIQAAAARIDDILLANLSSLAGRAVTASSVSVIEGGRRIIIRDVALADMSGDEAVPVLTARRVLIETALTPGAIPSAPYARYLRKVEVVGGALNLRRDLEGNWNLFYGAEPVKPEALEGLELEIALRDSRLRFEDESISEMLGGRRVWEFDRVSGVALLDADAFHLSFKASAGPAGPGKAKPAREVDLAARIGHRDGTFDIVLSGTGFGAAEVRDLASQHGLKGVDGTVSFAIHMAKEGPEEPPRIAGHGQLANGRITYGSMRAPVTGITARVEFDEDGLRAGGRALLAGQPIGVNAAVKGFDHPTVVADFAAEDASVATILDSLFPGSAGASWRSDLPARASVGGQAIVSGDNWSVAGRARSPGGVASGHRYDNVDIEFVGTPEGARVNHLSADVAGGAVTAEGIVRFSDKQPSGAFDAQLRGIDLSAVGAVEDVDVHGRVQAAASGTFAGGTFDLTGRAWAEDVGSGDLELATATLDLRATQDAIHIESAHGLGYDGSQVEASGTLGAGGELDLAVRVDGLDLGRLPIAEGGPWLSGSAMAYGRVGGTLKEPQAIFEAAGGNIGIQDIMVPMVYAVGLADRSGVYISHTSAVRAGAVAYGAGSILFQEDAAPVDGRVWFEDVALGELWPLLAPDAPPVHGTLSGFVTVRGTVDSPAAVGAILGDAVVVGGVPLGAVACDLEYADETLYVDQATAEWLGARVELAGRIGIDGALDLSYAVNGVRLGDLAASAPAGEALSGVADAVGTIGGTLNEIEVFGSVYSPDVTAYGESAGAVSARVWIRPEGIRIERGVIALGDETVEVRRFGYAFDRDYMEIDANASAVGVDRLLRMAADRRSPIRAAVRRIRGALAGEVTGTLHASANVYGERERLSGEFDLGVDSIAVGGESVGRFDLAATGKDGQYTISELSLSNGGEIVKGSGTYSTEHGANVELAARNLDLELLRPWLPTRGQDETGSVWEGGSATLNAVWSGKGESRRLRADLWIDDITLAGLRVDRIGFDDLDVARGQATLRGFEARLGENVLTGEAAVPLDVESFRVDRDRPMTASVVLDKQSIASLADVSPEVRSVSGTAEARITIDGTLNAPRASGYIRIEDGAVSLHRLESGLTDIAIDLEVGEDTISIARCEGRAGKGGVEIGGEVRLDGLEPSEVDLTVRAEGALVDARNLSGRFGERFRGLVGTRDIAVTGPWREPAVSGSVAVQDGNLDLVGTASEKPVRPVAFPIDPHFSNVRISFGEGLWVRTKLARALAEGHFDVNGSLGQPILAGEFTTDKGTIWYFTTRFKIEKGQVIIAYQPPIDPAVGVSLQATGREQGTDIVMAVEGVWAPDSSLDVQLTSDPPLSRDEIFALLSHTKSVDAILRGGGDIDAVLREEALNVATTAAFVPAVLFPFEEEFERGLGLEQFSLGLGYGQPFMVSAEKRLFDGVSLEYNRVFSGDERGEDWRVFYRVGRRYRISWTQDRLDRQTVGVEAQYRF